MNPYRNEAEAEVHRDFKKFANVVETWPLFDTILICRQFYGNEIGQDGWYNSWAAFGAQEKHNFFKSRTESAGPAYCNMQSADSMDFAFMLHSIGIAVWSPAPNLEGQYDPSSEGIQGDLMRPDLAVSHWWASDLPNHMGIDLKIQQDIRMELPCIHCPPGYGAMGSGTANQGTTGAAFGDVPINHNAVVQGVPLLDNRFALPTPIGIPRTATIEGTLHLSETARTILQGINGPFDYQFNSVDGLPPYEYFPRRYGITMSLFGERMVQQRAQYHK